MKVRKQIKRVLAMFLIVIMASTSTGIISFARTENSAGATNDSQSGPAGNFNKNPDCKATWVPAWMVYIQKVDSYGEVPAEIYAQKITQTECKYAAITQMRYSYPQDYQTGDNDFLANGCALIVDKGGYSALTADNICIYSKGGNYTFNNHVYFLTGSAPSKLNIGCASDNILDSVTSMSMFRDCIYETTEEYYEYCRRITTSRGITADEAVDNFVKSFNDIGSLANKLIASFQTNSTEFNEWKDVVENAQFFNLLTVIDRMTANDDWEEKGGYYAEDICKYLETQNRNDSDCFYIPVVIAGFVANDGNGKEAPAFYSLPTFYERGWGSIDLDSLFNITYDDATTFGNYREEGHDYENAFYQYVDQNIGAQKSSKYYPYREGSWYAYDHKDSTFTSYTSQLYTCLPTNYKDETRGNAGYTYFTFGGQGSVPKETLGQFNITASSEQKNVTAPNTSVAALINIDLNCTTQQRQSIRDAFDNKKKEGYTTADIIVDYSYASVAGNGSSSPLIDTVFTSGATLSGGNRVTLSNMTYDKLKPYIEGSKLIQVADSGILINGATTNKYLASVTIKFPDKSYKMLAKGKKIESDTQGSDTVMWGLNDMTGMDESVHYYSSIGKAGIQDNYVEIKHNTPGHEEYEAMAGIPTTEDLYVGFGITEFMINMDAERAESPASTRYYTYEYKAENCYGHDEPCVYSCSKNHKGGSGGCNALICKNTDPKHIHGGSCYCKSGHYTKDDFDCSDDGKWEWVCDCSGKVLASGSGKATYGPGYTQCIGVDGSDDGTGGTKWGCEHQEHLNTTHCGVTFTGVVEQPIDSFYYLDITDLDLCNLFDNFVQICVKCELSCKRERGRIGVNEG